MASLRTADSSCSSESKRTMPTPLPPILGLMTIGKRRPRAALDGLRRMIDDGRARVRQTERMQQRKLQGFRGFDTKGVAAVHDADAGFFQVREVAERIEDRVGVAASPGRWAHAIENQPVLLIPVGREVEMVMGGI